MDGHFPHLWTYHEPGWLHADDLGNDQSESSLHDVVISILLGIIEGVTEFLPVSSTAHLRIMQALLKLPLDDPFWKMYAVVIQLGAVLCLPTYFWGRIVKFTKSFGRGGRPWYLHPLTLVMVAFVCTVVPVLAMEKVISENLENLTVMGLALVIGGLIMLVTDLVFSRPRTLEMEQMSLFQAAWVGLIQSLAAIFPGTSRSMATIAAGQSAGLSRAAALEFSFFISMPTMGAACLFDLKDTLKPAGNDAGASPLVMTGQQWIVLGVGFVVSYIVALGVVAWFMHWVRRHGFIPFAIYRLIAGVAVLAAVHFGWLAQ